MNGRPRAISLFTNRATGLALLALFLCSLWPLPLTSAQELASGNQPHELTQAQYLPVAAMPDVRGKHPDQHFRATIGDVAGIMAVAHDGLRQTVTVPLPTRILLPSTLVYTQTTSADL